MQKISLKAARVNADLTQKEAAKLLEVSKKTLQNWESHKTMPRTDKITTICKLYKIEYDCIKWG